MKALAAHSNGDDVDANVDAGDAVCEKEEIRGHHSVEKRGILNQPYCMKSVHNTIHKNT